MLFPIHNHCAHIFTLSDTKAVYKILGQDCLNKMAHNGT